MSCSNCLGDPCHRWPTCPKVTALPASVPEPIQPQEREPGDKPPDFESVAPPPSETGNLPRASVPTDERPKFLPPPTLEQIPPGLPIDKKVWCCWKATRDSESKRWRKPPYSTKTNKAIGAIEGYESDFGTAAEAIDACKRYSYDGISIVFLKKYKRRGIDIDDCIVDGVINPEVLTWLRWFTKSYVETSPTGTGVHIICTGNIADPVTPTPLPNVPGVKCESYDDDRHFCFTGQRLEGHASVLISGRGWTVSKTRPLSKRPIEKSLRRQKHIFQGRGTSYAEVILRLLKVTTENVPVWK